MGINKRKVAFHTLGCKLNFAETSTISRSLPLEQFERVGSGDPADVHVVNTCSVTETADKKCRQLIKQLVKRDPEAFIVVVGCYAQLNPEKISTIKGVDLILGNNEKYDIANLIPAKGKNSTAEIHSCELTAKDLFREAWSAGDRTRSFLKVQDGCDYKCSYCTIPMARGNSRNPSITTILEEAEKIAREGVEEIVFTGVNIGDFGKSTGDSFIDLLKRIVEVEGIHRYRISSIEPNLLTDEIIRFAEENEKIMPHFHIPLQNGNNRVLGAMRRRYKREVFADRVMKIKEIMPFAAIGADVILGFPGESEEEYEDTYTFIESLPVSYLHVFPFSERSGTVAAQLEGKVPYREKEKRCKKLISLSDSKHLEFMEQNIGRSEKVLFEGMENDGSITGFTGNYIRVEYPWDPSLTGHIKEVIINGIAPSGRMTVDINTTNATP
jgi:threonylcarbamoyladenosine tRNA methylthiotransferase MtaB